MTDLYHSLRTLACLLGLFLFSTTPLFAQEVIFEDNFEGGPTPKSAWTFTPGADGGVAEITSSIQGITTNPQSGEFFAAVLGRSSDGAAVTNTMDLALDLSGRTEVELTFDMQNIGDNTQEVGGATLDGIFFSDDSGQSFTQVLPFRPTDWSSDFYSQPPPIDVDALAAANGLSLNEPFVIRFQQHDDSDFVVASFRNDRDGLFIDNVRVTVPDQEYATLPFADDFEDGTFGPAWKRGYPQVFIGEEQWLLGGIVEIRDVIQEVPTACSGDAAVVLGRRVDGGFNTNALDLRLDLSGQTNVDMTFRLLDRGDETQNPDGLWFSDDGGATFRPVLAFEPTKWSDDACGALPPVDVDRLAAGVGLSLTDQFVIRFQQHDNADFIVSSFRNDRDGLFIDDVRVYVPDEEHVSLPFIDGFESGAFGAAWGIADADDISRSDPDPISQVDAGPFPGGIVAVASSQGGVSAARTGSQGAILGRRADGLNTTNALDLRLDLSNQTDVNLQFWLKDQSDETQALFDRVMISDDGGASFENILELDPQSLDDATFNRFSLDLASMASMAGVSLTSGFVVRFQQHGDSDFLLAFLNDADGFFIDDIRVVNRFNETAVAAGDVVDQLGSLGILAALKQLSGSTTLYVSQTDVALEDGDALNLPSDGSGVPQLLGIDKLWHVDFDTAPTTLELDLCFDLAPYRSLFPNVGADVLNVVTRDETASAWTFVATTELRDATGAVVASEADATRLCAVGLTETSEFGVVGPSDVLPVELSAFTASMDGTGAVLTWTTASESGNAGFGIERSLDGASFAQVGFVDGAGTTTEARSYRFTDRTLPFDAGVVTYRLRQVDLDGSVAFSDAIAVRPAAPTGLALHGVFPNPVRGTATVRYELPKAGPVRLALYNVLGQQVQLVADGEARAGRVEHALDTGDLASGVYFLRLETPQGVQTQRLSVVR